MTREALLDFFSTHDKVMLQFSAGKDSAACLWLLEEFWGQMDVVWVNPGNPYPETLAYMEKISKLVPRFKVVLSKQPQDIAQHGWPVDVVPMEATQIGQEMTGETGPRLRPFWECCWNNMWGPMLEEVTRGGYDGIIRGQKLADSLKGPLRTGSQVDGVEYFHPLEDWTDEQVKKFLGDRLPDSYKRGLPSSLDCMDCTAYAKENAGRIADLEAIDETSWVKVTVIHKHLLDSLDAHLTAIRNCHGR